MPTIRSRGLELSPLVTRQIRSEMSSCGFAHEKDDEGQGVAGEPGSHAYTCTFLFPNLDSVEVE